ncbi:MAG: thiamine ABC transporter substrate-binding protein [Bdellovibrionales bacterium]
MKHFILYLSAIFLILFLAHVNKNQSFLIREQKAIVKIFTYSSFASKWGPGPVLKELYEQSCNCIVEFIEGADTAILLQRLRIEGKKLGADLVVGFDQYDLQKAVVELNWRSMDFSSLDVDSMVKSALKNEFFVPYDWGVLSFVTREDSRIAPTISLDDLTRSDLTRRIALQDPRTSSVGLQFVMWVLKTKGTDEGWKYLERMMQQAHSYSPSWSTAYGLFKSGQVDLVFSYVTSPLYHLIEEKNENFRALEMVEPQPVQVEFAGIPSFCRYCQLAEGFLNLLLSPEGQKIVMEKNYMMPVLRTVRSGTPFENLKIPFRLLEVDYPSVNQIEQVQKQWSDLRRKTSL